MREATSKNWKNWQSQSAASFDVLKAVVKHRDEQSAWEAAALIPRYHWLRPVVLHWCLLRCRQATRPWRAARDVWIFGQKISDLMRTFDVKVTFDATGLVPGSHYRHEFQISWISPIITVWILWIRFDSGNVTFFMRGFAPASMAEISPATLAFTSMPRGQD